MSGKAMSSETPDAPAGQGKGSPASGCLILGMIVTVFGGLVILYTVIFFVQKGAIADFTEDEPATIPPIEPTAEQVEAARGKLFAIKAAASQGKRERVLLTRDDLNTLIATAELLEDFRGTTRIERITPRGIETRMTQPMRKMPLSKERRHLNATFVFQPELRRRTIALRVLDIIPDRGTVPEQFVKNYDTIGFFKLDPDNPLFKPIIPRLSRVYTEEGHVTVETGTPADDGQAEP